MTIGSRVYKVAFDNVAISTANTFVWHLVAPADRSVILHGFSVTSDYATDERARLLLARFSGTAATGGAGATEAKTNADNSLTSESTVLIGANTGTRGDVLGAWRWSQQGELLYLPTPEIREVVPASGRIALELAAALGGSRNWSGWVAWEEV